jgi:hypothetical protein
VLAALGVGGDPNIVVHTRGGMAPEQWRAIIDGHSLIRHYYRRRDWRIHVDELEHLGLLFGAPLSWCPACGTRLLDTRELRQRAGGELRPVTPTKGLTTSGTRRTVVWSGPILLSAPWRLSASWRGELRAVGEVQCEGRVAA